MDEKLAQAINNIEAAGKQRFGEKEWGTALDAIGKTGVGISEDAMRQIAQQPDPANVLFTAGKEALLNRSDAGDKEAEYAYAQIRQGEREAHRRLKGRA